MVYAQIMQRLGYAGAGTDPAGVAAGIPVYDSVKDHTISMDFEVPGEEQESQGGRHQRRFHHILRGSTKEGLQAASHKASERPLTDNR